MLRLMYDAVAAGAPSQYGDTTDRLLDRNRALLQGFPKADGNFAAPGPGLTAAIAAWIRERGVRPEPVIVMVHGYLFNPIVTGVHDSDDPFNLIYGMPPVVNRRLSWLPLVGECDENGQHPAENAIAFTYRSEAGLAETSKAGWSNSYQYAVFDLAPLAARALASVLAALSDQRVTVRVLAHSLGTRTISQAIRLLRGHMPANLDRVVLMDGAEFCADAASNFAACPFDVINVVNRTDSVLRLGADQMCHPMRANRTLEACVVGYDGVGGSNTRWVDLQLDNRNLSNWLAGGNAPDGQRYTVNPLAEEDSHPTANLNHWACYTNDGNRALVRALLASDAMTCVQLRAHGVPAAVNAPSFGRFDGLPVPVTLRSAVERQQFLAQAMQTDTGRVG